MWWEQVEESAATRPLRRGRGDDGAAAVEAAFVLPLLVMLIFGIYAVCQAYNTKVELTGAVREGARTAALGADDGATRTQVRQTMYRAAPGLVPARMVETFPEMCPDQPSPDAYATVQVTYDQPLVVPFFGESSWTITAEAAMRCGL